jgi:2-oxoglutarate dehydrogenase E2 component (dihydrolipoamide succinyltransferase)
MGVSVAEGTLVEWRRQPGDRVEADEVLAEVTTDKVDVEIPCPASGVLEAHLISPGETVAVGTPIAAIRDGSAAGPDDEETLDRSGFYSPVVRRIAQEHHIDLGEVEGTGVGGRVRKRDLVALIEAQPAKPNGKPLHTESPYVPEAPAVAEAPAANRDGGERRETMSPMRAAIARHMVESRQTAAHCTTIVEVDMHRVMERRAELREATERRGVKLTPLAFVARAVVEALGQYPILNASVNGEEIVHHDDVNLGIAVALEDGLIVPVIQRAQRLSLEGLGEEIGRLAELARSKQLEPDDVHGGTFTITNPGQFGAVLATPIINQPQVGILDLEAIVKRPVVLDGDAIAVRPMAYLPMSWDHRALDGATAARFLGVVKERLESWEVD